MNLLLCLLISIINARAPPQRIINGYIPKPFSYPFMVTIQYDGVHDCGGVLYKENVVLTAAHCKGEELKRYAVLVHRHDLSKKSVDEGGQRYRIKEFIAHPEYQREGIKNDIAIAKLRRNESARMGIILDDVGFSNREDLVTTVIGWGMDENGKYPDILRETKLPILDINYCASQYATRGYKINSTMVYCAGYPDGRSDTCNADSGGPAFIVDKGNTVLVGLVSWGNDCGEVGFPGFYVKIQTYVPWILDNI